MHIIIDCTTTQNQMSHHGVGVYTENLVRNIIKHKDVKFSLLLFDGKSKIDPILEEKRDNVEIVRIGKVRKSDFLNYLWYLTQYLPNILKIKQKDSVYFCPYFWVGIPSLFIPTVLMIHDMILPIYNIYSEKSIFHNLGKKILYWIELSKAKFCKYIVVNSTQTKKDFIKYFPKYDKEKIKTIFLDGNLEGQDPNWNENLPKDYKEKGYFIYIGGTVYKNKNAKGVVDGYKDFLNRLSPNDNIPYMIIAGGGFIKDNLVTKNFRKYVKEEGLENKVIFTGFYEDEQVEQLLSHSIATINLSLYEGFGIALVNGMKVGTPVIAHNGSCYPEVLGGAGLIVDGLNRVEVGKAIFDVYTDKELRERLIKKGLERGRDFSWEKTANETLKVLSSL